MIHMCWDKMKTLHGLLPVDAKGSSKFKLNLNNKDTEFRSCSVVDTLTTTLSMKVLRLHFP